MAYLHNTSIRQRLTLIIMGISCASVLAAMVMISVIGIYNFRVSLISELEVSAKIIGDRNIAALTFGKSEQAMSNLSVLEVKKSIVQACLYDEAGKEFASYVGSRFRSKLSCPNNLNVQSSIKQDRIKIMQSIEGDFGITGYIYLEATTEELDTYIHAQVWMILKAIVIALLVSLILSVVLRRVIARVSTGGK